MMKNLLKKLHLMPQAPAQAQDVGGDKPTRKLSGGTRQHWLTGATRSPAAAAAVEPPMVESPEKEPASSSPAAAEAEKNEKEEEDRLEEYQLQLALEMSAREDPEAVQIEVAKQISLGSCPLESSAAEVIAYRYWSFNALSYDDRILDGFYDICGIWDEPTSITMPVLSDLKGKLLSSGVNWEAVVVNRKEDAELAKLEQKALAIAADLHSQSSESFLVTLVQKLSFLVADHMGGTVCDPESLSLAYQNLCISLRECSGSMVFPIGHLSVGLARHRALLFKVLADKLGIPCRLVKGKQYVGTTDGALNIVKFSDGREYIVDLMADPGTLIPADGAGLATEFEESLFADSRLNKEYASTSVGTCVGGSSSSLCCSLESELPSKSIHSNFKTSDSECSRIYDESSKINQDMNLLENLSSNTYVGKNVTTLNKHDNADIHVTKRAQEKSLTVDAALSRSPSSESTTPAVRKMKVKDVSDYMINAAKENPQIAQKLQDVLLESGVVVPPDLFSEYSEEHARDVFVYNTAPHDAEEAMKWRNDLACTSVDDGLGSLISPQLGHEFHSGAVTSKTTLEPLKPVEGLGFYQSSDTHDSGSSSQLEPSATEAPLQLIKQMPVAAAVATAAVVASSMVVAAAKSNSDINFEVPVAAAATVTAAAVVATTAAVTKQYDHLDLCHPLLNFGNTSEGVESTLKGRDDVCDKKHIGGEHGHEDAFENDKDLVERNSDKSTGTEGAKSDIALDDVAELEIQWEDIALGERIGIGSFGEVYRGEWHGTEVAVKKFLHQDISSDALEEFRTEVLIMRRLRHPNVLLLMGAVTRVPHLSIVTEFLPRGSLFRLIHRASNQLDDRKRLRMALDVARGMNYLHNCTPIIVHRDLKSPNLLVDKNWIVKVCDFGLSRMKNKTFLSSRSTAGTAEWMAPEVLRNEPSDEKCDVFSFGVILWELCTMKQPWEGMNPMQVVGAVGFQHRRLDIPDDTDPVISDIINKCWQTNPKERPSFMEIMSVLKPLLKNTGSTQSARQKEENS